MAADADKGETTLYAGGFKESAMSVARLVTRLVTAKRNKEMPGLLMEFATTVIRRITRREIATRRRRMKKDLKVPMW